MAKSPRPGAHPSDAELNSAAGGGFLSAAIKATKKGLKFGGKSATRYEVGKAISERGDDLINKVTGQDDDA